MRKAFLLSLVIFASMIIPTQATECTKFLVELYSKHYDCPVKITARKEFVEKYEQKIANYDVASVVYGYGFMKLKECKKTRITYITLMDKNTKPIWGYVIPR